MKHPHLNVYQGLLGQALVNDKPRSYRNARSTLPHERSGGRTLRLPKPWIDTKWRRLIIAIGQLDRKSSRRDRVSASLRSLRVDSAT
jgi:hypothetical protein